MMIVGMGALQSYQRFQALSRDGVASSREQSNDLLEKPAEPKPKEDPVPPELHAQLMAARAALEADRFDEAGTIAELVLTADPPPSARQDALHIVGWAHLLEDRPEQAARVVAAIERHGEVDLALVGAVLLARGDDGSARELFETARANGDDRKEVVGPLIQILIRQGEIARAAAIAFDIVDSLSSDDARQMAELAFDKGAYEWASRLSEAMFERTGRPEDAYDAARSRSLEGDAEGALNLLRRAVAAGFSDAARAWSDAALERLRSEDSGEELEALLPPPS
jgi:hypothetical protein